MAAVLTRGVHHVGLTVTDLEVSAGFFTEILGWERVGDNPDYPAVFVSDGVVMVTLWRAREPSVATGFDKNNNVGLHHLALNVADIDTLDRIYQKLVASVDIAIEFAPEPLREGPAIHMMCREPGGIRIEFIVPG
ncbi:MAG: VOC family protein [Gammaproteobacteria bacterium]|nr:VOC family protein [Gammaproteobacteria bacterium]